MLLAAFETISPADDRLGHYLLADADVAIGAEDESRIGTDGLKGEGGKNKHRDAAEDAAGQSLSLRL